MRNPTLHELLEAFARDAGAWLRSAAINGEGVPFELTESDARARGDRPPLYCYRPLTESFIRDQQAMLAELPDWATLAQTLEGIGGLELYMRIRASPNLLHPQEATAERVLIELLARVYEQSDEFAFEPARFELAYEELERALYEDRCVTEFAASLFGIDFDPQARELALGDGLAIVRSRALAGAPPELAEEPQQPLLVLRVAHERSDQPSAGFARSRFERILTALRLYERGAYAIGVIGYTRVDAGAWSPIAVGSPGRRDRLTLIPREGEEELRGFCNVVGRRLARGFGAVAAESTGSGEVAWALSRFEMGAQRAQPLEALTDHLLALRALLEPEGPASGRLTQRLAVICAAPERRAELAQRAAAAVALERSVITGLATASPHNDELADELAEHLRAILRDVLCGHLEADLCAVADELLAQAAEPVDAAALI